MGKDLSADNALVKLAALLKVPVESFRNADTPDEISQTVECLKLWQKIESGEARQRALDGLRLIAQEDQAIGNGGPTLQLV